MIKEEKYIVIVGDPVDGLEFYGPFTDIDLMNEWAGQNLKEQWWTARLYEPKEI